MASLFSSSTCVLMWLHEGELGLGLRECKIFILNDWCNDSGFGTLAVPWFAGSFCKLMMGSVQSSLRDWIKE